MRKARILKDDPVGRWLAGEIGILLVCDFEKYDYFIDLGVIKNTELFGKKIDFKRNFFFYEDDVEIVPDDTPCTSVSVVKRETFSLRLDK